MVIFAVIMQLTKRLGIAYIRTKFKFLSAISKKKAAREVFELFCTPPSRHLRPLPPIFAEAEKLEFPFQDYTIRGYRWNKGGKRKALILHGFESSAINFEKYISPLISKGYEVMAFDAPAHGRSSGKKVNGLIYRNMIIHIQEVYGPIHSFMAHSFGGLALAMALAEMPHDEQYRLVFIAPLTETKTTLDLFFGFLHLKDPLVRKEFDQIITAINNQPVSWFSIRRSLQNIQANVLWIHDEDDEVTPFSDALRVKQENHPRVEFVVTKGLGHRRIYREAATIEKVTGFL